MKPNPKQVTAHSKKVPISPEKITIHSEAEMLQFGQSFADYLNSTNNLNAVIELIGDVGAGKTTFVRGLAEGLGIKQPITSPSFTISKTYTFPKNHTLTHYDFYRLSDPGLMKNDLEEKIKDNHLVLVEWGNTVANFLPENRIRITIVLNNDDSRDIEIFEGEQLVMAGDIHGRAPKNCLRSKNFWEGKCMAGPVLNGSEPHSQNHSVNLTLYLDTSTPNTILKLNNKTYNYEFNNTLSKNLLQFIHDKLKENHKTWTDLKQIIFMSGPGSFTGLRIGAAVVNTLAHELNIPLYDHHGKQHKIILPDYGREANISAPKK